jgi:hypothetical protein
VTVQPSREFKASDPAVRDIAAVFALKGWTWTTGGGEHVPKAGEVADWLNRLYESAVSLGEQDHGQSSFERLFVDWVDAGYGHEIRFGIEWTR